MFLKSKEQKDIERKVRIRKSKSVVQNYINKLETLQKRVFAQGKEYAKLGEKQMVRNQFDPADWPPPHSDPPSNQGDQEHSVRSLTKHALQRLHRLQAMTDETSAELHQLERLLSKSLTDAGCD